MIKLRYVGGVFVVAYVMAMALITTGHGVQGNWLALLDSVFGVWVVWLVFERMQHNHPSEKASNVFLSVSALVVVMTAVACHALGVARPHDFTLAWSPTILLVIVGFINSLKEMNSH